MIGGLGVTTDEGVEVSSPQYVKQLRIHSGLAAQLMSCRSLYRTARPKGNEGEINFKKIYVIRRAALNFTSLLV